MIIKKYFYKGVKIYNSRDFYFFEMNGVEHGFNSLKEVTNYINNIDKEKKNVCF